jgi:predicted O-linked N-acetylglucosamine transferase (SPINDLY family)
MATDILTTAVLQSMARSLSVTDLIRTIETFKQSGQVRSAETLYSSWIQSNAVNPLLYAVLFNYSVMLADAGRLPEARECLERALALNPEFMPAYINLGRIYERQGAVGPAIAQWSAALAKMSGINGSAITFKTTALNQSARALETANQDESAENMLRLSLELDCHQREVAQHYVALRQRQCEWPVVVPWERVSQEVLRTGMSPLSTAAYTDDPLFQLAMAWHYNRLDVGTPPRVEISHKKAAGHTGPLRIGYLSSDLREHAVGYLMTEVPGLHNRKEVEVFSYYCGPESRDVLHENFKKTSDHWLSINGMDDAAVARRMAEDGIQILVDLNGYTREARLKLLALRPAPVIVNWLGYPGTMGSPYHHYIISDDWIIPESHEMYYSEKVLRLPCYQPNNRRRAVAPTHPTRQEAGLPEKGMVYCCFNGAHKINRFTFERWMMILNQVPESVLWLLSSTPATNERLKRLASERGVEPGRIVFAEKLANPYHLARYVLADLFLDTAPYGAHTTASDALFMGVPLLTLSGRSFASRVCGSLARSSGIPELVCSTAQEYVETAVSLGNDPARLESIREKLRAEKSSCVLFDTPLLVRRLEQLYREMWADFQRGTLPTPDLRNLDVYLEVGEQVNNDEVEMQTLEDYHQWWLERLATRHAFRPVYPDQRLVRDVETLKRPE